MDQHDIEIINKIPKDSNNYIGEFIVFFPDDEDPKVLFHSLAPGQAADEAQRIKSSLGREPFVFRVPSTEGSASALFFSR